MIVYSYIKLACNLQREKEVLIIIIILIIESNNFCEKLKN